MSVLTVVTGEAYTIIAAAVDAAAAGDTIDINAGTYEVSDLKIAQNMTLVAVGGTFDIGYVNTFITTNSTSEDAVVGHEVKSRAEKNIIEDNQIIDGPTGTASYSIDLPNGGNDIVQGNTIDKGPDASAPIAIHIGGPEMPWVDTNMVIQDNTFINNYGRAAEVVENQFTAPVTLTDSTIEIFLTQFWPASAAERHCKCFRGKDRSLNRHRTPRFSTSVINLSGTSGRQTVTVTRPSYLVVGGSGLLTVISITG
jgi:hypothetical protein